MNNFKFYMEKVSPTVINEKMTSRDQEADLSKIIKTLYTYLAYKSEKKDNEDEKEKNKILFLTKSILDFFKIKIKNSNSENETAKNIEEILSKNYTNNEILKLIKSLKDVLKNNDTKYLPQLVDLRGKEFLKLAKELNRESFVSIKNN